MIKNRRFRWRNLATNYLLAILTTTIFFGALETYARISYGRDIASSKGFLSRGKEYTVNKQTAIRIVCLGGSTTHGENLINDDETYPFYLEQSLTRKLGDASVEVLNSGMPGTTTEYHSEFVKNRVGEQELDIILLHSLYNHFSPFDDTTAVNGITYIVENSKVTPVTHWDRMTVPEALNLLLTRHSAFYTRLREKLLVLNGENIGDYYAEQSGFTSSVQDNSGVHKANSDEGKDKILRSFLLRYDQALEELILAARSNGVNVVLVIPPYPYFSEEYRTGTIGSKSQTAIDTSYYRNVFEQARQRLTKVSRRHDLLLIDADRGFVERGRDLAWFKDMVHLTPEGNRVLADIISEKLTSIL